MGMRQKVFGVGSVVKSADSPGADNENIKLRIRHKTGRHLYSRISSCKLDGPHLTGACPPQDVHYAIKEDIHPHPLTDQLKSCPIFAARLACHSPGPYLCWQVQPFNSIFIADYYGVRNEVRESVATLEIGRGPHVRLDPPTRSCLCNTVKTASANSTSS